MYNKKYNMEPFIYKIIDKKKDKVVYVGQHNGNSKYYEGSGVILNRYKNKYGTKVYRNRFELIKIERASLHELDDKEKYWIKKYNTFNEGFNLTPGGVETLSHTHIKGKSFPKKNKKLKGLKRSIQTKSLISESMKGYQPSKLCHQNRRKKLMKPILQYDLDGNFIKEWNSGREAYNTLKLKNYAGISACCLGKLNTSNGFIWRYKENNVSLKIKPPTRKVFIPSKINPTKRKLYKKGVTRIKNQSIIINKKQYNSITSAAKDLGWSFGKLNWKIKNNQIKYKWVK